MVHSTIISRRVSLSIVVGLNRLVVAADPLPVHLVEGGGLEDEGGDDTLAVGGFHGHLDFAVEDVPFGLDRGRVGLLLDDKLCALVAVLEGGAWEGKEMLGCSLGEVDIDGGTESDLGWAG